MNVGMKNVKVITKNRLRDQLAGAFSDGGLPLRVETETRYEYVMETFLVYIPDNGENESEMAPEESEIVAECSDGCDAEWLQKMVRDESCLSDLLIGQKVDRDDLCQTLERHIRQDQRDFIPIVKLEKMQRIVPGAIVSDANVVIAVLLRQNVAGYKGIVEYVLMQLIDGLKRDDGLQDLDKADVVEKFVKPFRKNWYLMGRYAEYYLEKSNLPTADQIIELSAARYEGSESAARIYFTRDHLETISKLSQPPREERTIRSDKCRMIRKLMEISRQGNMYLYAEKSGNKEFAVQEIVCEKNDQKQGTDLYIKFSGFLHWSVYQGTREEFTYRNGKYELNCTGQDEKYIHDIDKLKGVDTKMLKDLAILLRKQKHGAIAIVSDFNGQKVQEIDRLCKMNRAVLLDQELKYQKDGESCGWNEACLLGLSGVDGALFMDLDGNCFAFSVLLDGEAVIKGDVGRGARYNSTVNYVERQREGIYIGIIVSEDGMINVVSNQGSTATAEMAIS